MLTHRIQGAKRWSHFQESLNTALRASLRPGLDPSCLTALITAALTTAPKVLRRQYGAAGAQVEAESAEVVEAVQEMLDYLRPRLHQLDAKVMIMQDQGILILIVLWRGPRAERCAVRTPVARVGIGAYGC